MEWEPLVTLVVFGASVAVVVAAIVLSLWGIPGSRARRARAPRGTSRLEPRGIVLEFRRSSKRRSARR